MMRFSVPSVCTIAGTDPSGGAGIQADLKTFQEREVYGMSVITSVVAQNTLGVSEIDHLSVDFIDAQLRSVFSDITPDVVKTGMIATKEMMQLIGKHIKKEQLPYVMDPVMIAKSGEALMDGSSQDILRDELVPLATIVTPNIPEAEILLDTKIKTLREMEAASKQIVLDLGAKAAIVKGGHSEAAPVDVLFDGKDIHYFDAKRIETVHTHGTGCTFSACMAAELAKGKSIAEAVAIAKEYITAAIYYSLKIGQGNGPTNHWGMRLQEVPTKQTTSFGKE